MPICLEPDQEFPVYLKSDENKPIETRPTFLAKSQSMRSQKKIAEVLDRLTVDPTVTTEQLQEDAVNMLATTLAGWKNMGKFEFCRESIYDVLDYQEARELLSLIYYNQHVNKEEKKSSESQP